MSEQVLIVQNSLLSPYIQTSAGCLIKEDKEQILDKISKNQMFMARNDAEHNYDHKQVIPYVVIRHEDSFLLLKRLAKQTEKRLHNKYSLGIGGHVNPDSAVNKSEIIVNGLYRELNEEVSVGEPVGLDFVGVINDESNSVSRVHIGLMYILEVKTPEYEVLETDKMTAQWVHRDNLKDYYENFETWSQIAYDYYLKDKGSRDSMVQGCR